MPTERLSRRRALRPLMPDPFVELAHRLPPHRGVTLELRVGRAHRVVHGVERGMKRFAAHAGDANAGETPSSPARRFAMRTIRIAPVELFAGTTIRVDRHGPMGLGPNSTSPDRRLGAGDEARMGSG